MGYRVSSEALADAIETMRDAGVEEVRWDKGGGVEVLRLYERDPRDTIPCPPPDDPHPEVMPEDEAPIAAVERESGVVLARDPEAIPVLRHPGFPTRFGR